jgi:hypothetical protein
MSYILKRILVGSTLCFFMLVSIPLVSATDYIYPPEDGPYLVSAVGMCDTPFPRLIIAPGAIIKIGPLCWFAKEDNEMQFSMWNNTVFKINGKQQNYTLTAKQNDFCFWGFKGIAPLGMFGIIAKMYILIFLKLRVPSRVYGVCTAIYVTTFNT